MEVEMAVAFVVLLVLAGVFVLGLAMHEGNWCSVGSMLKPAGRVWAYDDRERPHDRHQEVRSGQRGEN
jgi:hypothetical protein